MCIMCLIPFLGALGLASLGGGGFLLRMRSLGRAGACSTAGDPVSECRCAPDTKRKQGA